MSDITIGSRFGLLVIVETGVSCARREKNCRCICDCGRETFVRPRALLGGRSKSCGCEGWRGLGAAKRRLDNVYVIWKGMNDRCRNPNSTAWKHYGGRGIRVCDEWQGHSGFTRFKEHIGPRPSPAHSIDRIDNDGNYEPGNVRWATAVEQRSNKRNSRLELHEPAQIRWLRSVGVRADAIANFFGIQAAYVYRIAAGARCASL